MGEAAGQRRAAHQQRRVDADRGEVTGGEHHLLGALDQQAGEADHVGPVLAHRLDELLGGDLDTEIDHREAVVGEHDLDQVLADVVHVALDRGEQHFAACRTGGALHEALEVGDRRFHHFGRLQHLGDDQSIVVEQPPDLGHAGHQRAVDHLERRRPARVGQGEVEIRLEPLLGPFDDGAREPLVERQVVAPPLLARRLAAAEVLGERRHRRFARRPVAHRQVDQRLGQPPLRLGNLGVARQPLGVDDRRVEAGLSGVVKEDRVEHLATRRRQSERDVGDAEDRACERELALEPAQALDRRRRRTEVVLVAGAAREGERVPPDVLRGDPHLLGEDAVAAPRDLELAFDGNRHPLLVDQADDECRSESPAERYHPLEPLEAVLEIDRVEDCLALTPGEPALEHPSVGRIEHQRRLDHPGQAVEEGLDVGQLVAVGVLQADVEHLRPRAHLGAADLGRPLEVPRRDALLEGARTEDVGLLADQQRPVLGHQLDRFEAGDEGALVVRHRPRRPPGDQLCQRLDVRRGGTAAAADQVEPPLVEEAAEDLAEDLRPLEVAPLLVGQAGVGHAGDAGAADLRQGAQVIGHQRRAGGAVEPDVEQIGVQQRDGERFGVLAREHRAGRFDGRRDGDGQAPAGLGEGRLDADQPGLDVARVLAGLEQQVVGTAGHQPERLGAEVVDQSLEGHAAGDRDRLGGRAHRAGDEAQSPGTIVFRARFAGERRGEPVELESVRLETVLGEHQRRAAEGVGLDDVGARGEVALGDAAHHVGPGAAEVLVAPLELGATEVGRREIPGLEGRAGGAVEDEQALLERLEQRLGARLTVGGLRDRRHPFTLPPSCSRSSTAETAAALCMT